MIQLRAQAWTLVAVSTAVVALPIATAQSRTASGVTIRRSAGQTIIIGPAGSMAIQGNGPIPPEVLAEMSGAGMPPGEGEQGDEAQAPSQRLAPLQQQQYDRRPSAILAAWAELEAEQQDEVAATGEAEVGEVVQVEEVFEEPVALTAIGVAVSPSSGAVVPSTPLTPAQTAVGQPIPAQPTGAQPEPEAEAEAVDAEAAAAEAAAAEEERRKAEEEAKRASEEAKAIELEMRLLRRNVTLGRWDEVGSYLGGLTEEEGVAGYEAMLRSLVQGPQVMPQGIPPQGQQFLETNQLSPDDVVGLAQAAPRELSKQDTRQLGQLLRRALDAGHQLGAFLREIRPRLDEQGFGLSSRELARLLVAAGEPLGLEGLLPTLDEAVAADDREALNLLARYCLARNAEEGRSDWLEQAWHATQAALAAGDIELEAKREALTRAVDIAPRITATLGQAWLDESFTSRPERGMEILATIGGEASQAQSRQPADADARLRLLKLQTTATEALLAAAPQLAAEWGRELSMLAANWLREAQTSYELDESTSRGPRMQRDAYGNVFWYDMGWNRRMGMLTPIPTGEVLEIRPGEAWLEHVEATLRPRLAMVYAQLLLKVAEEAEAFPYIEALAASDPRPAKELVDEFLRVWATNHNPNADERRSQYTYFFGFEERAGAIPLTRSKQERNLADLAMWVARLRALPVEVDDALVTQAFQAAHSSAEIYRLETIEQVFGSLAGLEPETLAALVQTMRANLATIWRDPALQRDAKTNRRQQDIQAEVLRGYDLANATVDRALEDHRSSWQLMLARAALAHDENDYRAELAKDSEFTSRRLEALELFQRAAELYADAVQQLDKDEESAEVYQMWFYAALGASDLRAIDPKAVLASREIPRIREAIEALPGERAERHLASFASTLFARMSNANPAVKFRYVREGLAIVGDHPLAREAREVFDYYNDLVTEIRLVARVDGSGTVGTAEPFGLRVDLRHTAAIERESGGFAKYLQNQNNQQFAYNYGRPLEDYRDKFEEAAREVLSEHFEVLSVTFNDPEAKSIADPEYGWRVTPYAYLLMKPRGPQVDVVPPLRLDLDFLDTSGYAVLPIESAPAVVDCSAAGEERPFERLTLTQTLDERQAIDGRLVLEVKAGALGLVPPLESVLDLAPEGFDVVETVDHGVAVVKFDEERDGIVSERTWTLTLHAQEGLPAPPDTFAFGTARVPAEPDEHFRYVDADLASVGPVVDLEERYLEPDRTWVWWIPAVLVLGAAAFLGLRRLARPVEAPTGRFQVPEQVNPFTVLGVLRDIQARNGLSPEASSELEREIAALEATWFGDEPAATGADLRQVAERWVARAR